MDAVEEIIEVKDMAVSIATLAGKTKELATAEKNEFFERVNAEFPIEERDSFQRLISNDPDTLVESVGRNNTLHIVACLMRQSDTWTKEKAIEHFDKVGWHGLDNTEIYNTVNSAFAGSYTYSTSNLVIASNMTPTESQKIQQVYTKVAKDLAPQNKIRFSTYEFELLARFPYLRKNEVGIMYQYVSGVYKKLSDQQVSDLILSSLYDDALYNFRTKKNVSDKVACLLSIIPPLTISDNKGYIVNVKNGLLDLQTKKLMPHTPNFVSLSQVPINYDPKATAPTWDKCITEWMSGAEAEEKARLLQQFAGYCLSPSMLYDKALFMVGDGGNGKSTFIEHIAKVIGEDSTSYIDLEDLYSDFGLDGLIGMKLNIIEEVSGNYYQSNKLKKLVSGELVTIKIKYKPQFKFKPQAKFVFAVNIFPRVDDTSTATERRICCLTFLNNWRNNPNKELRSDIGLLTQELPGILNWMIDGAIDLDKNKGFIVTDEQIEMLNEYREENSSVEGFIASCIVLNEFSSITTTDLYAEYDKWVTTEGGRKPKAAITFTKEMKAYGAKDSKFTFEPRVTSKEEARFIGVGLNPLWVDRNKEDTGLSNQQGWHNK